MIRHNYGVRRAFATWLEQFFLHNDVTATLTDFAKSIQNQNLANLRC